MTDQYTVTAAELRQFIGRYELAEAEKKDISEVQKEIMAEAVGRGYDAKALREIIRLRKMKSGERAEREAAVEMYLSALGMA